MSDWEHADKSVRVVGTVSTSGGGDAFIGLVFIFLVLCIVRGYPHTYDQETRENIAAHALSGAAMQPMSTDEMREAVDRAVLIAEMAANRLEPTPTPTKGQVGVP